MILHVVHICYSFKITSKLISFWTDSRRVAPVDCTTSAIRIRPLSNATSGRVEICINNVWGTVCDNGFGYNEAAVVCGQLNMFRKGEKEKICAHLAINYADHIYTLLHCSGAIAFLDSSTFGSGTGPVFLEFSGKKCLGTEDNVLECNHRPLSLVTPTCASSKASAAVICPGM